MARESKVAKLSLFLGGLFFVAAALQFNDPDPLPWISLYVAAGVASLLAACAGPSGVARFRNARIAAAVVGVTAMVWVVLLAPTTIPHLTVAHLFESMKAETPAIEESRELFGLVLIVLWMITLFFRLNERPPRA